MMGVANLQRWALDANVTILSDRLEKVIAGIALNQEADGYAMGYTRANLTYRENANYVMSWVTHGLIEASISGHSAALPLIRNHMNWFNYNDQLPLLLPPDPSGDFVVPDDIQPPHQLHLTYQGIIPPGCLGLCGVFVHTLTECCFRRHSCALRYSLQSKPDR